MCMAGQRLGSGCMRGVCEVVAAVLHNRFVFAPRCSKREVGGRERGGGCDADTVA